MNRPETVRHGFTLIELVLVVAIVLTLAGMAIPRVADFRNKGRYTAAVGDVRRIEAEILAYLAANRVLPASLALLSLDGLKDPWGRGYVYSPHYLSVPLSPAEIVTKPEGARTDQFLKPLNNDFDLYSLGPDGISEPPLRAKPSRDDVVRAVGGAYIGKAEDF